MFHWAHDIQAQPGECVTHTRPTTLTLPEAMAGECALHLTIKGNLKKEDRLDEHIWIPADVTRGAKHRHIHICAKRSACVLHDTQSRATSCERKRSAALANELWVRIPLDNLRRIKKRKKIGTNIWEIILQASNELWRTCRGTRQGRNKRVVSAA